jgi:hypothetical protein
MIPVCNNDDSIRFDSIHSVQNGFIQVKQKTSSSSNKPRGSSNTSSRLPLFTASQEVSSKLSPPTFHYSSIVDRLVLLQLSILTPVGRLEEELHMLLEAVPAGIHLADTAGLGERLRIRDFDHSLLDRTAVVAADSLPVAGSRHHRHRRRHTVVAAVADIHPVDTLLQMLLVKRYTKNMNRIEFLKHRSQFKVQ